MVSVIAFRWNLGEAAPVLHHSGMAGGSRKAVVVALVVLLGQVVGGVAAVRHGQFQGVPLLAVLFLHALGFPASPALTTHDAHADDDEDDDEPTHARQDHAHQRERRPTA